MSDGIMLKVSHGEEMRRFPLSPCQFSTLDETLRRLFSFSAEQKLKVRYQDEEKDWVDLSTDRELELAVQISTVLRLDVYVDDGSKKPAPRTTIDSNSPSAPTEMEVEDRAPVDKKSAKIHARVEKRKERITEKLERKQAKLHKKIDCKHQKKLDKLQKKLDRQYEKQIERSKQPRLAQIFVTDPVYSCAPGGQIIKTIKIRNCTNAIWPEACNFTFVDGVEMSLIKTIPIPALQPGMVFEISIPITAPNEDGKYITSYQLIGESGTPLARPYKLKVIVGEAKKKYETIPNAEQLIASLVSMGFEDRNTNEKFVHRCKGDLDKVVMILAKKNMKAQKKVVGH